MPGREKRRRRRIFTYITTNIYNTYIHTCIYTVSAVHTTGTTEATASVDFLDSLSMPL